jgi:hypothetical protein
MTIEEFKSKYGTGKVGKMSDLLKKSVKRRCADDLLGIEITAGLTLADLLSEGKLNDSQVSDEVKETLSALMGDKVNTQEEAINYFRAMIENGDASAEGLVNKLKGTLGELKFQQSFGDGIQLSESGSQEGFDLITDDGKFIQVKMYQGSDGVIDAIEKNAEKMANHEILYDGQYVEQIDYAVSSNIYEELKSQGVEAEYGIQLHEVPMTAEKAGNIIRDEINEAAWEGFFSNALGVTVLEDAIKDTVKSTGMTVASVSVGYIAEGICLGLMPPLAPFMALGTSVGTRVFLRGVSRKADLQEDICKNGEHLEQLVEKLECL